MKLSKHKYIIKRLLSAAVCACILCGFSTQSSFISYAEVTQDDINDIKDRQSELEALDNELDSKLEEARKDISKQKELCKALSDKIDNQQKEIDSVLKAINILNNQISAKEEEISGVQAEIDSDTERLRQRIRSLYLAGETSTLEILLGAKDFDDLMDKSYLIKAMGDADAEIVDSLNQNMESIKDEKALIEADKAELLTQKSMLETKMSELDALQMEYNEVLSNLEGYEDELLAQKNENAAHQESLLDELNEAEAALAAQYASQNSSGSYVDSYYYVASGSGYCWPAPQCPIITSYWGDDRGHKGIDLACSGSAYGTPIVAAQSGTVSIANGSDSWGSGWGYYIKIDHGGGYETLYAHCSSVIVSAGQYVERGQLIGYVGNTGNSYGAHLHFECWYNGVRYDPLSELA